MTVGYIDTEHLTDIANAIRQQNGTTTLYKPSEMAQVVLDLDGTSAGSLGTEPYKTIESGVVSRRYIQAIVNAIRTQNGLSVIYKPEDMAQAILDLTWSTLAPRALLLSDGTLEFTYLNDVAFKADMANLQQLYIAYWLMNHSNVTSITGIANLGVVKDMTYAFACTGVSTLDFRGFDASNLSGSLMATLYDCDALTTIHAGADWALPSGASDTSCFSGCDALVGGAGTTYASSRAGYTYFRIDTAETSGYLTVA